VRALLAVLDTNGNGTTAPTTSFPLGTMTKDMIPIGWAHVSVSGGVAALVRGVNVNAIAYIGGGTTNVTFNPTVSNATDCICLASTATQDRTIYATPANSGGKLQVQVVTRSLAPASVDTTFFVAAWGS
jgi:hypothetical protein